MINPGISVVGNYEINGNVLDENVFGHGKANITLGKDFCQDSTRFDFAKKFL